MASVETSSRHAAAVYIPRKTGLHHVWTQGEIPSWVPAVTDPKSLMKAVRNIRVNQDPNLDLNSRSDFPIRWKSTWTFSLFDDTRYFFRSTLIKFMEKDDIDMNLRPEIMAELEPVLNTALLPNH